MAAFLVPSCPLSTDFQPENGEEDREVNLLRAKYLKVTSFGKLSFCRCFSVPPGLGGQILVVNAFTDFFFFLSSFVLRNLDDCREERHLLV